MHHAPKSCLYCISIHVNGVSVGFEDRESGAVIVGATAPARQRVPAAAHLVVVAYEKAVDQDLNSVLLAFRIS
jgi:hypothetical protein